MLIVLKVLGIQILAIGDFNSFGGFFGTPCSLFVAEGSFFYTYCISTGIRLQE